jgi:hypothetical protein
MRWEMKMKKQVIALSIAALGTLAANAARAAGDSGPYVGASVGAAHLTAGGDGLDRAFAAQGLGTSTSVDRSDTTYSLTAGYRFN